MTQNQPHVNGQSSQFNSTESTQDARREARNLLSSMLENPEWDSEPDFDSDPYADAMFETGDDAQDDEPCTDHVNALDVEFTPNINLGWITEYSDLMHELTGSPREFHELAGLITAATAIQGKARLNLAHGTVYPNLYGCFVAPSSVYGKSVALDKPRQVLTNALMDKLIIASSGSTEGLVQQLSETPNAIMIRDEIGTLFGSDRVKYLVDYKQELTNIFDGRPIKRRLRMEEIKVAKPYLNIIGATTPVRFYGSINISDWTDGLLPRWLFAIPTGAPNFDTDTKMMTEFDTMRIQRLALKLMEIDKFNDRDFIIKEDAMSFFGQWRKASLEAAFKSEDEIAMAIVTRYATYALKFAIILAAVNDSWGVITLDIMKTAIQLANNYKCAVNRIIKEADKHRVTGAKIQKVFGVIKVKNKDGKGVTLRTICQFANLSKVEAEQCIERLAEYGAIMTNEVGKTIKYIHTVQQLQVRKW